eukprot:jgi/Botrbrau1/13164/Bobra.242_1s0002.1
MLLMKLGAMVWNPAWLKQGWRVLRPRLFQWKLIPPVPRPSRRLNHHPFLLGHRPRCCEVPPQPDDPPSSIRRSCALRSRRKSSPLRSRRKIITLRFRWKILALRFRLKILALRSRWKILALRSRWKTFALRFLPEEPNPPCPLEECCPPLFVEVSGAPHPTAASYMDEHPMPRFKDLGALAKLCLDNCGNITQGELERGLQNIIPEIQRVKLVTVNLGEDSIWRAGWAVVYTDPKAAPRVLEKLNTLYVKSSDCPLPRPLFAHFPWKDYNVRNYLGHVEGVGFAPHFAQPNSIEYEPALEWRRHEEVHLCSKKMSRERHIEDLEKLMHLMKADSSSSVKDDGVSSVSPPFSTCLWLRGLNPISFQVKELLKDSFVQWGVVSAEPLRDPVTGQLTGQAIVQFRDHAQAYNVCRDLQDMVYIMGSTPRPVQALLADPGGPTGNQAVFDKAFLRVLAAPLLRPLIPRRLYRKSF